ncbi:hypothetical protein BMS81_10695 [Leuconostoc pseudomesenteroides]|nr:hypothetical protein BMS81_10695 [Leuconostoc pseudomesenteroides]
MHGVNFKTIYNWLNAGRLKLSLADLPDKGIRQKRQSDGRRQVFVHGRSIETRPESVKAHFQVSFQSNDHAQILVVYHQIDAFDGYLCQANQPMIV